MSSAESDGTSPDELGTLSRELYFPTFIYFRDLANGAEINRTIRPEIYKWRAADREGIERSNVKRLGSWHSGVDMMAREEFRELTDAIFATAQKVFDDLGYEPEFKPKIDNMWANIGPRFGYNRNHTHPNVLWSGVYYVQTPADCGRIFFSDPRAQAHVLRPSYGQDALTRPHTWSEVYFEPIAGRVILFPAWLVHEVEPNMTTEKGEAADRISVSFNIYQSRQQTGTADNDSANRLAARRMSSVGRTC